MCHNTALATGETKHQCCDCTCTGTYLPLTAVLGGLLFVRVEGYLEADRDVIRLDPDVATMQAQQGYVCCMPPSSPDAPTQGNTYAAPLHCCVRVLPSQVLPKRHHAMHNSGQGICL